LEKARGAAAAAAKARKLAVLETKIANAVAVRLPNIARHRQDTAAAGRWKINQAKMQRALLAAPPLEVKIREIVSSPWRPQQDGILK
jgi:hypothetical protein